MPSVVFKFTGAIQQFVVPTNICNERSGWNLGAGVVEPGSGAIIQGDFTYVTQGRR